MDVDEVFVGRAAELSALTTEIRTAASGRGRTVVVLGAPGAGKTHLVRQALAVTAAPDDATGPSAAPGPDRVVLQGGCVERPGPHYPSVPFAPFVEALRRLRGTDAPADVQAAARAWARPGGSGDAGGSDTSAGEDQVLRRFTELLDVLEAAAAWRPVVLVLDDLQWADPSSLALLVFLARNVTTEPILLAATLRDPLTTPHEHLDRAVAELHRAPAVRWLSLDPLPDDDVAALVHRVRGTSTAASDVRAVVRRAEGNALAAAELARHRGDDLPRSYSSAVIARLAELSPDALDVLRVVATVGRTVEPEPVARLVQALRSEERDAGSPPPRGDDARRDDPPGPGSAAGSGGSAGSQGSRGPSGASGPTRLDRALDEAAGSGLLAVGASGYTLRHGLDREVVLAGIPPWLARRLHAHVARELERSAGAGSPEALAEIADHWSRSGDEAAAFGACVAAARAAVPVRAFPEAVALLRRALGHRDRIEPPLWEAAPPAAQVRLELAEALRLSGDVDGGIALLEDTLRAPMPADLEARCWERLAWLRRETGDGARANAAYLRALDAVAMVDDDATRARVMASHAAALMIFGSLEDAGARAREALAVAAASGSDAARASALDTWGVVAALRGEPEEGLRALREAHDVALACGSDDELWRAVSNTAYVLQNVGREQESVDVVTRAVGEPGEGRPHPPAAVTAVGNAISALILLGRWDEALGWVEWCRARRPADGLAAHVASTEAELRVYRDDGADEALAAAHTLVDRSAEPELTAALWRVHAEHLAWRGRTAEARDAVDRSVEALGRSDDPESLLHALAVALRVEADAAVLPGGADATRVDRLASLLAGVASSSPDDLPDVRLGSALCAAELARARRETSEPWPAVAALAREIGRPLRLGYALLRLGEHELATGARRAAAEHLVEAHGVATRLGAAPLLAAVGAVARRARVPVGAGAAPAPAPAAAAPFGLTAREAEVLHLLADGATNRQIARSLFISERTAAVHVSHILTKLGAGTRQQAAAAAHRAGLLAAR